MMQYMMQVCTLLDLIRIPMWRGEEGRRGDIST